MMHIMSGSTGIEWYKAVQEKWKIVSSMDFVTDTLSYQKPGPICQAMGIKKPWESSNKCSHYK